MSPLRDKGTGGRPALTQWVSQTAGEFVSVCGTRKLWISEPLRRRIGGSAEVRVMYIWCTLNGVNSNTDGFPMALLSAADHQFLKAVSRVAFANPFLPDRIELEREALGDEYQPGSSLVWSRRADVDEHQPNRQRLAARAATIVDSTRAALADGKRSNGKELALYEDVVLYVLYDRFRPQLQAAIQPALEGAAPAKVAFWSEFKQAFAHYLSLPERPLPSNYKPAHIFAGFFQVRRAFHHIFDYIVGQSLPTARLRAAVWQSIFTHDLRRYRRSLHSRMSDIATLISGPSGTGKELVARAVGLSRYIPFDEKKASFTDDFFGSFHPINLSALSPTLIESELFGHAKGAFTGATADRTGWLEHCKSLGTVFMDEIGELDPSIQAKLLRAVQARTFARVGETQTRPFQGKLIAATNRDLAEEMLAGRFRADLYYRLCSDLITTTSLREQLADAPEDLHNLVLFVAQRIAGDDAEELAREVELWIETRLGPDYPWPGNIRELEQCVRNCLVRGEYHPARPKEVVDDAAKAWLAEAERGSLTADALLTHYCRSVYRQVGTYEGTAERIGLDRRTVKRRTTDNPT
jgi:sigma-54 specific flagellar transcriptional regulator A